MFPSPDTLNNFEQGKYVLSNLAAKRAKQLREGAPPLVQVDSQHPLTIALAEIAAGKIKPIMPTIQEIEEQEVRELDILTDELLPAELGIPLPGLDELEIGKVPVGILAEDDHDHDLELEGDHEDEHEDEHEDAAPITLSDFVEDDEEEVVAASSDDDTMSLSDLAEQETTESEDEEDHEV